MFGDLGPQDWVGGNDCLHPDDSGYDKVTAAFVEVLTTERSGIGLFHGNPRSGGGFACRHPLRRGLSPGRGSIGPTFYTVTCSGKLPCVPRARARPFARSPVLDPCGASAFARHQAQSRAARACRLRRAGRAARGTRAGRGRDTLRAERSTRTASRAGSCSTVSWYRRADSADRARRAAGIARGRCAGGARRRFRMPPTRATSRRAATSAVCGGTARTSRPPAGAATDWVLRFESVNYRATVWLNGRRVGSHSGGYLPFEVPGRGLRRTGVEPARRAGRQPPRRNGRPADRPPQGRPVRRRLVELRRHPARGLPAQGRHARPRQRERLHAPVVSDLPGQDLRARGGREPPGHPRRRGAHGHASAATRSSSGARRSPVAASICSAAARRSRTRGSGARPTRISTP